MESFSIIVERVDNSRWQWKIFRRETMMCGGVTQSRLVAMLRATMWLQDFAVTAIED